MSFIDYNKLFNGKFLETVEIPPDSAKWHTRTPMEKEIFKNIDNIINKNKYSQLNDKEVDILKKFTNSINIHESNYRNKLPDKSDITIKQIINDILHLPIEELLVLLNEIQINETIEANIPYYDNYFDFVYDYDFIMICLLFSFFIFIYIYI
jgi:hypothetical protein